MSEALFHMPYAEEIFGENLKIQYKKISVFRTLLNILNGNICETSQRRTAVQYFRKKLHLRCFTEPQLHL